MPVQFPDEIEHNNPSLPVVATNNVRASSSDNPTTGRITGKTYDGFLDRYTGHSIQAFETNEITEDGSVDSIIYFKNGAKYYRRSQSIEGFINLKWFGAIGDGVTDDTNAIQMADNAANVLGKGLFIPKPNSFYLCTAALTFNAKTVQMESFDPSGYIRFSGDNYIACSFTFRVNTVFNFCIAAINNSSGLNTLRGLNFTYPVGAGGFKNITHIRAYNFQGGYGCKFDTIYDAVVNDCSVEMCGSTSEYAFWVTSTSETSNQTTFIRLQVEQSIGLAIKVDDNVYSCDFYNIHCERTSNTDSTLVNVYLGSDGGNNYYGVNLKGASGQPANTSLVCYLKNIHGMNNNIVTNDGYIVYAMNANYNYTLSLYNCNFQILHMSDIGGYSCSVILRDSTVSNLFIESPRAFIENSFIYNMTLNKGGAIASVSKCKFGNSATITETANLSSPAFAYFYNISDSNFPAPALSRAWYFNCTISKDFVFATYCFNYFYDCILQNVTINKYASVVYFYNTSMAIVTVSTATADNVVLSYFIFDNLSICTSIDNNTNNRVYGVPVDNKGIRRWLAGEIRYNPLANNTDIQWAKCSIYSATNLGTWINNQTGFAIPTEGTWAVTIGSVLTAATATYSKVGKQIALSGTFTFATAATDVTITLPYAPDYGGTIIFGNLTFTLTSGSTTAKVQSSVATTAQTFQLNYKTA